MALCEDPRVRAAWRNQWDPDHYLRLLKLRDAGFSPKVIYDIGGHEGRWSEMTQALFQPATVCVFEPQTDLHRLIKERNQPPQGWGIFGVALGDREGAATMHVTGNEAASSLLKPTEGDTPSGWRTNVVGSAAVQVHTLDGFTEKQGLPAPDLVKIDVQGFEGNVVRGGARCLAQASLLVIEVSLRKIYDGQAYFSEIVSLANDIGFRVDDMNDAVRDPMGGLWQADLWFTRK